MSNVAAKNILNESTNSRLYQIYIKFTFHAREAVNISFSSSNIYNQSVSPQNEFQL